MDYTVIISCNFYLIYTHHTSFIYWLDSPSSSCIQQICVPPSNIIFCLSVSVRDNSTVKHSNASSTIRSSSITISKHLSPATLSSGVSVRGELMAVKSTSGVAVCVEYVWSVCVCGVWGTDYLYISYTSD